MPLSFSTSEPLESTSTYGNTSTLIRDMKDAGVYAEIAQAIIDRNPQYHMDMGSQTGELLEALRAKQCQGHLVGVEEHIAKARASLEKLSPAILMQSEDEGFSPAAYSGEPDANHRGIVLLQEDFVWNPRHLLHLLRECPIDSASYAFETKDMPLVPPELQQIVDTQRQARRSIILAYMTICTETGGHLTRAERIDVPPDTEAKAIPAIVEQFRRALDPFWTNVDGRLLESDVHNIMAASDLRMGRFDTSYRHGILLVQGQRTDQPCEPDTIFKHFDDVQCDRQPL